MREIEIGDVVISAAGKDKGGIFLVTDVKDGFAWITDGKRRKVGNPKKKNPKHLIKAAEANLKRDALKIKRGEPFGNKRLKKAVSGAAEKLKGG